MPPPRFYYSFAFDLLIREGRAEIDRRLHDEPTEFRIQHLKPRLMGKATFAGDDAWEPLRAYLEEIEAHIAAIARNHSPAYWLHLYRRIAPTLSKNGHDQRRTTVALVRRIAELACYKHGDPSKVSDLGHASETRAETFMDGHYLRSLRLHLGGKLRALKVFQSFKRSSQTVLSEFTANDLYNIFEIEGFSYEYWRTTAVMRMVGKGASFKWDSRDEWLTQSDIEVHPVLFHNFDTRGEARGGFHTRLGTWSDLTSDNTDRNDIIIFAQYNVHPEPRLVPGWNPTTNTPGSFLTAPNFEIGSATLESFFESHAFMAPAFKSKHKFDLSTLAFAIWGISMMATIPDHAFKTAKNNQREQIVLNNLTNLFFRGYTVINRPLRGLTDEILTLARAAGKAATCDRDELDRALAFMTLSVETAKQVGLWSGGRRPLLIPLKDALVADIAGLMPFLNNLFFGIREKTGAKGFAFEDSVRAVLATELCEVVHVGRLKFADGSTREVDAAVRVGERLVILECFSYEMPVDAEIAKPGIFELRKAKLEDKLKQAITLSNRLVECRTGDNFDFSWAEVVDWRLVSPFIEFNWALDEPNFDAEGTPRILALDEVSDFLKGSAVPDSNGQRIIRAARNSHDQRTFLEAFGTDKYSNS